MLERHKVAVLIPCFNEAISIGKVVRDFRVALPDAHIYVYDNNSSDDTQKVARDAGAIVRLESLQGKGHVVRRMFADVDAEVYVLVDGDDTYDASSAPKMVDELIRENLDMLNVAREASKKDAYRSGHRFGNWLLTSLVRKIFSDRINDMLSGYRIFSRRFVKSFPVLAEGFEIETELTIHALELNMPIQEQIAPYKERLEGSESKLNTYSDGLRILRTIVKLVKEERPLAFFSWLSLGFAGLSIGLAAPVVIEYFDTGLVLRLPTAVLSLGLMLLAFLSLSSGLVLDTVTHGRREMKRLHYLAADK